MLMMAGVIGVGGVPGPGMGVARRQMPGVIVRRVVMGRMIVSRGTRGRRLCGRLRGVGHGVDVGDEVARILAARERFGMRTVGKRAASATAVGSPSLRRVSGDMR